VYLWFISHALGKKTTAAHRQAKKNILTFITFGLSSHFLDIAYFQGFKCAKWADLSEKM